MVQHSVGTVAIECGRAQLRSSTEPSPIPERLFPAPMAHHVLSASTRTHSDPGDNSRDTIKYQHILIFRHNPSDQLYNVVYVCIKRIQIRLYYINRITRFKHMAQLVFICRVTLPFHRDNTWVRVRNLNRVMARVCSFVRSFERALGPTLNSHIRYTSSWPWTKSRSPCLVFQMLCTLSTCTVIMGSESGAPRSI